MAGETLEEVIKTIRPEDLIIHWFMVNEGKTVIVPKIDKQFFESQMKEMIETASKEALQDDK